MYTLDGTGGLSVSQRIVPDEVIRLRPAWVMASQLSLPLASSRTKIAPSMVTCSSDVLLSTEAPATIATMPKARLAKIWERILVLIKNGLDCKECLKRVKRALEWYRESKCGCEV